MPPPTSAAVSTKTGTALTSYRPRLPPPVPSKAALRILYQLAYISTGAVVGAGLLCAEERRRRIQILQRVADNARVLKDVARRLPAERRRYTSASPSTSPAASPGEVSPAKKTEDVVEGDFRDRRKPKGRGSGETSVEPELPYGMERKHGRKTSAKGKGMTVSRGHGSDGVYLNKGASDSGMLESQTRTNQPKPLYQPFGLHGDFTNARSSGSSKTDLFLKGRSSSLSIVDGFRRPARHSIVNSDQAVSEHGPKPTTPDWDSSVLSKIDSLGFKTRWLWDRYISQDDPNDDSFSGPLRASAMDVPMDAVADDVKSFLSLTASPPPTELDVANIHPTICQLLFHVALELGSLEDIRKLLHWKVSARCFTIRDFELLCSLSSDLASRTDGKSVISFYTDLLQLPELRAISDDVWLKGGMTILQHSGSWKHVISSSELVGSLYGSRLGDIQPGLAVQVLGAKCRELLARSQRVQAIDLYLAMMNSKDLQGARQGAFAPTAKSPEAESLAALMNEIYAATATSGDRSLRTKLLCELDVLGECISTSAVLQMYLVDFIEDCHRHEMYEPLVKLYAEKLVPNKVNIDFLSEHHIAILAIACSTDGAQRGAFERLYWGLTSKDSRAMVEEAGMDRALVAGWKATGNFNFVEGQYQRFQAAAKHNKDPQVARKLDIAFLECCVLADKLKEAGQRLSDLRMGTKVQSDMVSLMALLFARRKDWDLLDKLLQSTASWNVVALEGESAHIFNTVIRLFAMAHGPTESWKFASDLIDRCGLVPHRATHEVVLQSFVSGDRPDLIAGWLRYIGTKGMHFVLQSSTAVGLMRCYYREKRPASVLLMWQCRALVKRLPTLKPRPFVNLLQEALAFDAREYGGSLRHNQSRHAQIRLERVLASDPTLPTPGLPWNEDLVFHDSPSLEPARVTAESEPHLQTEHSAFAPPEQVEANDEQPSDPASMAARVERDTGFMSSWRSPSDSAEIAENHAEPLSGFDTEDFEHDAHVRTGVTERYSARGSSQIRRKMITALSLRQHDKVMRIYDRCYGSTGIAPSPLCLEIAIESTLQRNHQRSEEAEMILAQASEMGTQTRGAMTPLLINRMRRLDLQEFGEAQHLHALAVDYYKTSKQMGGAVTGKVAVHAANMLIEARYISLGLRVLAEVFGSENAYGQKVDIAVMSVYLKAYIHQRSITDILWVVKTVVELDLRIDQRFLDQLGFARRSFRGKIHQPHIFPTESDGNDVATLHQLTKFCQSRRQTQKFRSKQAGWRLVQAIVGVVPEASPISIDERSIIEKKLFGGSPLPRPAIETYSDSGKDNTTDHTGLGDAEAPDITLNEELRDTSGAAEHPSGDLPPPVEDKLPRSTSTALANDISWLSKYRAFLDRPIEIPGGRLARFRRVDPSTHWTEKTRIRNHTKQSRQPVMPPLEEAHLSRG